MAIIKEDNGLISGGVSKTLLWSNSSPTSVFGAQTLTPTGLSDYEAIIVKAKFYNGRTDASEVGWSYAESKDMYQVGCCCQSSGYIGFRTIKFYGANIEFKLGKIIKDDYSTVSETPSNVYAIPLEIYGCSKITS